MSLGFVCCIHLAEAVIYSLQQEEFLWVSEDWLVHQEIALTSQLRKGAGEWDCT